MSDQETAQAADAPRRAGWKKWAKIGVPVVAVLYTLGGFVGVPVVIQKLIIPKVGERLNGSITLDKARCNPFALSLTLEGLSISDESDQRLLGFDRFYGNLQASSLVRDGFVFKAVEVDRPFGEATLLENGRINLIQLVKRDKDGSTDAGQPGASDKEDKPIKLPHLRIGNLAITNGHLGFFDQAFGVEPFEFVIDPLSFAIENLDTQPENDNPHRFEAVTDRNETVTWEGDFYLNPLTSTGRLTIEGIDLSRYQPYLGRFTKLQLASGQLGFDVAYNLVPAGDSPIAGLDLKSLTIDGVQVKQGDTALIDGVGVVVEGVQVDAVERRIVAQRVATSDGKLLVQRNEAGGLVVLDALLVGAPEGEEGVEIVAGGDSQADPAPQRPTTTASAGGESAPTPSGNNTAPRRPWTPIVDGLQKIMLQAVEGWDVELIQGEVLNYTLRLTDESTPTPVELGVEQVNLTVGPVKTSEGYVVPYDLTLRQLSPAQGTVAAAGQVAVEALAAEVTALEVQGLDMAVAGPYVSMVVPEAVFESGKVDVTGRAAADVSDTANPSATFSGDVKLSGILVDGPIDDEPMLAYETLVIQGIDFDHAAKSVVVDEIQGAGLRASAVAVLVADEQDAADSEQSPAAAPNASEAQASASSETQPSPSDQPKAASGGYQPLTVPLPYAVKVLNHTQVDGRLFVQGKGVEPEIKFVIDEVELEYKGFDTASDAEPGDLKFSANPGESGRLEVAGKLGPDFADLNHSYADLQITLDALPLSGFSGISGRYVGKQIDTGAFSLEPFTFAMDDFNFEAAPKLKITEFNFGGKVDSPHATKLPVDLAVAILKGPTGTIAPPNIPLSGPLNDPSVSVGGMIVHALGNLITGIAASPFDLLAGVLEGSDVDPDALSHVVFADGRDALSEESRKRMDLLAKGLAERPGLVVTLASRPATESDSAILQRDVFVDRVRQATLATLDENHPARKDPALLQLTAAQYRNAIRSAHASMTDPESETPGQVVVPTVDPADSGLPGAKRVRRPAGSRRGVVVADRSKSQATPAAEVATKIDPTTGEEVPVVAFEDAEAAVLAEFPMPEDALQQLERRRLEAVQSYFAESTSLGADRVAIASESDDAETDTESSGEDDEPLSDKPRVEFKIGVASGE